MTLQCKEEGYTLIEILIVVAILGLLAAIGIPSYLDAADRAKQRSNIAELRAWGNALAAYYTEHSSFPNYDTTGGDSIDEVYRDLVPFTVSTLHTKDHFGFDFIYVSTISDSYTAGSPGKDGFWGGLFPNPEWAFPGTIDYGADIVLVNGIFVAVP